MALPKRVVSIYPSSFALFSSQRFSQMIHFLLNIKEVLTTASIFNICYLPSHIMFDPTSLRRKPDPDQTPCPDSPDPSPNQTAPVPPQTGPRAQTALQTAAVYV